MKPIYIPRPARRPIWPIVIGAVIFGAFNLSIVALLVLARAIMGV